MTAVLTFAERRIGSKKGQSTISALSQEGRREGRMLPPCKPTLSSQPPSPVLDQGKGLGSPSVQTQGGSPSILSWRKILSWSPGQRGRMQAVGLDPTGNRQEKIGKGGSAEQVILQINSGINSAPCCLEDWAAGFLGSRTACSALESKASGAPSAWCHTPKQLEGCLYPVFALCWMSESTASRRFSVLL